MKNIMLDLETLGNDCIVQIGACYFDWDGSIGDTFVMNVSLASALRYGNVGVGELKFWLNNAGKISWLKDGKDLTVVVQRLREFIKKDVCIWSHYYDVMVLENVCKSLNQRLPFNHKKWRDIRTLVALSGLQQDKTEDDPKTHNALEDCFYQVDYCVRAFQLLKS